MIPKKLGPHLMRAGYRSSDKHALGLDPRDHAPRKVFRRASQRLRNGARFDSVVSDRNQLASERNNPRGTMVATVIAGGQQRDGAALHERALRGVGGLDRLGVGEADVVA